MSDNFEALVNMSDEDIEARIAEGEALLASVPMVNQRVAMLRGFLVGRQVGRSGPDAEVRELRPVPSELDPVQVDGDETEG